MLPGKDRIYACPSCGQKVWVRTLMTGNTAGAVLHSDGAIVMPFLPVFPSEVKCKKCGLIFKFCKDLFVKELNLRDPWESDWESADLLTPEDYQEKIQLNQCEEIRNRIYLWHTANGTYGNHEKSTDTALYVENCKRLIDLFSDNEHQRVFIAELHRNIGEFDTCMEILATLEDNERFPKRLYIEQCEAKNRETFVVKREEWV
ncbi:MAG: hypothetical protein GX802_00960 [Clostridiales bacterium]|nr:hypothetical protein [Clostridiales bacterium]